MLKKIIPMLCLLAVTAALVAALVLRPEDEIGKSDAPEVSGAPEVSDAPRLVESDTVISDTKGNVQTGICELSATGMEYEIYNTSETYVYLFGNGFGVEQLIDGKWYKVPTLVDSIASTAIGYELSPINRGGGFTANWGRIYGRLPAGQYRLVKSMDVFWSREKLEAPQTVPYRDYDERYTIAIEFEIK